MHKILGLAAVIAMAASGASALSTNIIVNGSFEDSSPTNPTAGLINGLEFNQLGGPGPGWDVYDDINGWASGANDAGIEIQHNKAVNTIDANDGTYYIELDSDDDYADSNLPAGTTNSSAIQSVSLMGDLDYFFTFAYSPRTQDAADSGIKFDIGTLLTGNISETLTSNAISQSLVPDPTDVGTWSIAKLRFNVPTTASYDVSFLATGNANELGGFIDSVHLAPVPLPAGAWLALSGAGLFYSLRKRRNVAAA